MRKIVLVGLLAISLMISFGLVNAVQNSYGDGDGVCDNWVDENNDGINDNRQMNGSGNQNKCGNGNCLGKRYGPGNGTGHGGNGPHDGNGFGPGNCQGE